MQRPLPLPLVFVAVAVIFVAVTLRNFLKAEGKLTPARQTWLRAALIFAAVAIGLCVAPILFP